MIYFIQDESVNLIKIGYTDADAEQRLRALQTGSPAGLVLLCCMPGDRAKEHWLHQEFAAARCHGEWFRPIPALVLFIAENYRRPEPVGPEGVTMLYRCLVALGLSVLAKEDCIVVSPTAPLTDSIRELIRTNKTSLLAFVKGQQQEGSVTL